MTKMLFNMKIIFTIAFIAVIWLLPEKGNAQKTDSPEAVFLKTIEAILVNSCLRKKKLRDKNPFSRKK